MKKVEAAFQTKFAKYLIEKKIYCFYEIKQTLGFLSFSSFEDQQLSSLFAAQTNGLHHKYSDADPRLKPFDGAYSLPAPAFVVIKYPDIFVMIPVVSFIYYMENSGKKGMSKNVALDMAKYACQL